MRDISAVQPHRGACEDPVDFDTRSHMSMSLLSTTDADTNVWGAEGSGGYQYILIVHIYLLFSSEFHKFEGAPGRLGQLEDTNVACFCMSKRHMNLLIIMERLYETFSV